MNNIEKAITIIKRKTSMPCDGETFDGDISPAYDTAIKALEEMSERDKGCEYCHKEWGTCDNKTNRFCYEGEINYCPKCGRRLTEQN